MQTQNIIYMRHRFQTQIIAPVVWHYVRFNVNLREVEEFKPERGVDVNCRNSKLTKPTAVIEAIVAPSIRPRCRAIRDR